MAPVFGSISTLFEDFNETTNTKSFTLTAGRELVVWVGWFASGVNISTAKWNGTEDLVAVGSVVAQGNRFLQKFALKGGTAGTHDIEIVFDADPNICIIVAADYGDVATDTDFEGAVANNGSSNNPNATVTGMAAGSLGIGGLINGGDSPMTGLTAENGVIRAKYTGVSGVGIAVIDNSPSGGSAALSGTLAGSDNWAFSAAEFLAAAPVEQSGGMVIGSSTSFVGEGMVGAGEVDSITADRSAAIQVTKASTAAVAIAAESAKTVTPTKSATASVLVLADASKAPSVSKAATAAVLVLADRSSSVAVTKSATAEVADGIITADRSASIAVTKAATAAVLVLADAAKAPVVTKSATAAVLVLADRAAAPAVTKSATASVLVLADQSKQIPVTKSATATVAVAVLDRTAAVPVTKSAAAAVVVAGERTAAVPVTKASTVIVTVLATRSLLIPVTKAATGVVDVAAARALQIPVLKSATVFTGVFATPGPLPHGLRFAPDAAQLAFVDDSAALEFVADGAALAFED